MQLKLAATVPMLTVLPQQRGVTLRDGKRGLRKNVGRPERPEKPPICCGLPL